MKRRFQLSSGFDLTITLDIDTDVMTPDIAQEVSTFWISKDEVSEASDGDVFEAVARYAAGSLLMSLLSGWNSPEIALKELSESEGWPEQHGITIVDYDLPTFDASALDVDELEVE